LILLSGADGHQWQQSDERLGGWLPGRIVSAVPGDFQTC
jgi:hypothetical protein